MTKAANKKINEGNSSEIDQTFSRFRTIFAQGKTSDLSQRRMYKNFGRYNVYIINLHFKVDGSQDYFGQDV